MEDRSEVEVLIHEGRKVSLVYSFLFVKVVVLVFWSFALFVVILLTIFGQSDICAVFIITSRVPNASLVNTSVCGSLVVLVCIVVSLEVGGKLWSYLDFGGNEEMGDAVGFLSVVLTILVCVFYKLVVFSKESRAQGGDFIPYRAEIGHSFRVVFKFGLFTCGNRRRVAATRKDIFLTPCWIDVGVLMLSRLAALFLWALVLSLWCIAIVGFLKLPLRRHFRKFAR